uniref:CLOCK-interacting pacemaker a n=1 Tax=Cyclopterus lumpus TaxID=8103 RepID=A0A8C2ZTV7_CYCLU
MFCPNRGKYLAFKPDKTHMLVSPSSDASSEHLSTVDLTDSEDAGRNYPIGPQVASEITFLMPQSQMVILQTMVSNGSSSSSNTGSENTRQSKSYVPILKSYPKIAPHPDVPTKRVGSSKVRVSSTSGYDQRPKRHHHGHRLYSSPSLQPALQTAIKSIPNFEAANQQSQAAESQDSDKCLSELLPYTNEFSTDIDNNGMDADQDDGLSTDVNKLKRFSNTYNILNKSGLLGITMRTKQLIKENKRTQGQLQQLQEQTVMLLEAQSTGDPQLWTKLQLSLQHTDKEQCHKMIY